MATASAKTLLVQNVPHIQISLRSSEFEGMADVGIHCVPETKHIQHKPDVLGSLLQHHVVDMACKHIQINCSKDGLMITITLHLKYPPHYRLFVALNCTDKMG